MARADASCWCWCGVTVWVRHGLISWCGAASCKLVSWRHPEAVATSSPQPSRQMLPSSVGGSAASARLHVNN